MPRTTWLCALLLLVPGRTEGTSPRTLADGYTRRVWQTQDGLPDNMSQAFAQTPDGYLWIGTAGGLVRFDGVRFVTFDRENTPQMKENSVFCLAVSRDGSLWAGTDGGGLLRYHNGVFRSFSEADGLANDFVRVVYEDHQGILWVGTDDGLFRFFGDRMTRMDGKGNIPALAVHAIREDNTQGLWVGGSKLVVIHGEDCKEYPLKGNRSASRVKSILETRDRTIWVGTVSGLQRMHLNLARDVGFERIPEIGVTVRALTEDAGGTLWIGTIGGGLLRYSDGRFVRVSTPDDPPSKTILAVFEDSEQNIWAGLQTALLRLSRTPMTTFPLPGAQNADFGTVYPDKDGALWVAAVDLYRINPRRSASELIPPPGPGMRVRNVLRDRTGNLWIGTEGHGVFVSKGGSTVHYTTHNGLTNDFIRAFLEGRDGSVWIGTDEGLNRWHQGILTNYRISDGLSYFSIRALLEDSQGGIWIGTEQGVSHWQNGKFVHDAVTERLAKEKVWTIHQDRDGGLWFGTRGSGVFRWRSGKISVFTSAQGLASNSIYQILEDQRGTFWMSGPNGIASVARADLDKMAETPEFRPAVTLYGLSDGLEATQMHGGVAPAGCITSTDELWFPSNRGPVRILPDQTRPGVLPQVVIEQVLVDGREVTNSGRLVVPPGEGKLEIKYSAIRLRSQERIRFRYQIEGFDRDWTEALNTRAAYYTNLPPGQYQFRVQAFEMNMPEKVTEASLPIEWRPHIYRTGWFLASCSVLIVGSVVLGYRYRLRQVHARFEAVLEERNRIAREMHDTVIQGCASASALLEAVVSLEQERNGQRKELLDSARNQIRATVDEARQAVWNLRQKGSASPEITNLLGSMAQQVSNTSHVPVHFESSGKPLALDRTVEYVLLMVAREAVSNAVYHAQPKEVRINVNFDRDKMRMLVTDDGRGFDLEEALTNPNPHFGLIGMRERIEHLGGRFEVESAPGRGTRLCVDVPVHPGVS